MPESGWTKGPWVLSPDDSGSINIVAPDVTLDEPMSDPWNIAVAIGACGYPDDPRTGCTEANAHLIAAAPAMAEALEKTIACIERRRGKLNGQDIVALAAARVALAQARGEQP